MSPDEEINSLDKEIIRLQKSTRTTVPAMLPLHDILRQKYRWYYRWSLWPGSKVIHVLVLLAFLFFIGNIFYQISFSNPKTVLAASATLDPNGVIPGGGDTGTVQWTLNGGTTYHWQAVSDTDGSPATTYVSDNTGTNQDIYNMTTVGSNGFTAVTVNAIGWGQLFSSGCPSIYINVYIASAGGWQTEQHGTMGNPPTTCGTASSLITVSKTWNGSWTAADLDGLQVVIWGGDMNHTVRVAKITADITYNAPTAPTVVTDAADTITTTSMNLNGRTTDTGGSNPTAFGFDYGCDGTKDVTNSTGVTGTYSDFAYARGSLTSNTAYRYRAFATNTIGDGWGSCTAVNVPATAPIVTTNAATNLQPTTATLNGTITVGGGLSNTRGFYYYAAGVTNCTGGNTNAAAAEGAGTGAYTANISGLTASSHYSYKAYGNNSGGAGEQTGACTTFDTPAAGITVSGTCAAGVGTSCTANTTLTAYVNGVSKATLTNPGASWSFTGANGVPIGAAGDVVSVSATVSGSVVSSAVNKTNSTSTAMTGLSLAASTTTVGATANKQTADFAALYSGKTSQLYTMANANTLTANGDLTILGTNQLDVATGQTASATNITIDGTLNVPAANTPSVTVSGNWSKGGTFNAGSSTVTMSGATKAISSATTFYNLTISGSISASANITIGTASGGNLTIDNGASLTMSTYTANHTATAGTLTVNGTLKIGGTNSLPTAYSTYTLTSGTVEYNGSTQSVATQTYGNLTVSAAGTKTLAGTTTVSGNLTVSAGTLDANTNSADLNVGGTWNTTGGGFTAGSRTVTFNAGATGKTITSGSIHFNHVIFSNAAGGWSFSDAANIDGNLTLTASETAANGVNLNNQTIVIGGNFQIDAAKITMGSSTVTVSGSWTSSNASSNVVYNTSVVQLNGSGNVTTKSGATTFYDLKAAYNTKTTTLASSTLVNNLLYVYSGGTLTGSLMYLKKNNGDPLVNTGATISSTIVYQSDTDISIAGQNFSGSVIFYGNKTAGTITYTLTSPLTIAADLRIYGTGAGKISKLSSGNKAISTNNLYVGASTANVGSIDLGSATHSITGVISRYPAATTVGNSINFNGATVNVGGDIDFTGIDVTGGSSTVTMDGNSKVLTGNGQVLNNLTIANAISSLGNFSVNGTFNINGGATFSPDAATVVSSLSGTLQGNGTAKVTLTGDNAFVSQYTIANKTLTGLTIQYAGAGAQTVSNNTDLTPATYGHLEINASGQIVSLDGATTVGGNFTLTAGTLNDQGNTLSVGGTWSRTGTFTTTGKVVFNGSGDQLVHNSTTFNNLDITTNASRNITFDGNSTTIISGNWNVTGQLGKVITMQSSDLNSWTVNPSSADISYTTVSRSTNAGNPFCAKYSTDGNNNSSWYFSTNDSCAPAQASGVVINNIGETGFKVDWTDNSSEDNFLVYLAEQGAGACGTYGGAAYATVAQNVTTKDVTNLNKNVRYCVGVAAKSNIFGESAKANSSPTYTAIEAISGVTWGAFTTTDLSATSANTPSNLSAGSSGIRYTVRKVSDDSLIEQSAWQQNTNAYDPTAVLGINAQYKFEIESRNGDGTPTAAATAQKYTRANPPTTASHSDINIDSVTWTWQTNSNPAGTEFYASDDSGINSGWLANATSWVATAPGKIANTQYTTTVKARNGDSIETSVLQGSAYTAIETPTTITSGLITPNSIALNLSDTLTNLNIGSSGIQYTEISGNPGGGGEAAFTGWPQSGATTDASLQGAITGATGTTYNYKIKARNAEGVETASSAEFSFTTTAGTQLLYQLPGETLDENGSSHLLSYSDSTPATVIAGVPFDLTIYAADGANYRDLAHQDTITLDASSDPLAEFPATAAMTNGTITYSNVVMKTVGNQTISGTGSAGSSHEFVVVAGACSASVSTASAAPTSLDTGETSTVTINLKDAFGNNLAGHTISTGSDQAGDNITFSDVATDVNGRIFAYVTSALAHTSTLTVGDTTLGSLCTLDDHPQITFNAPPAPPTSPSPPPPSPSPSSSPPPPPPPPIDQPPSAPTNLRATNIGTTTIDLAWNASTDDIGVSGYELYNAETNIKIATTTAIFYHLSGLSPDTTYRFYVRAFDTAGQFSDNSNTLSVTTKKIVGPPGEEIVAFLVMSNLPESINAGQEFPNNVRVSAADAGGKIIDTYNKAIFFSSSDKNARLAVDARNMYTYTSADAGIHEFPGNGFVLNTGGKQKLTVSDYSTSSTAEIEVIAAPVVPSVVRDFFTNPKNMSNVNTGVVTTTAAILLIPFLINTAFSLSTLLPQLFYWFLQLLELLGIRKRRKSWGVIFNSQSGQAIPLAMVRIFDRQYNRVLEQVVTDEQGRYGFLVREGTFYIQASKSGYTFPSKEKSSSFYEKIYLGGDFKIAGKDQTVAFNIPIDPHTKPGFVMSLWIFTVRLNRLLQKLRLPLLILGLIFALVMIFAAYNVIYLLSLVFYVLLAVLEYLRTFKARPYGIVTDTYNHPLGMVIVRIYRKDNNRLLETDVTDSQGRFRFLVAPGVYYLVAAKPGYVDFKSHLMYLQKEKTQVSTTIKLKKEEK